MQAHRETKKQSDSVGAIQDLTKLRAREVKGAQQDYKKTPRQDAKLVIRWSSKNKQTNEQRIDHMQLNKNVNASRQATTHKKR